MAKKSRAETFNDYDGFVEKFKPKKTTDDCYTPDPVYQTVKQWVNDNIMPLAGVEVIRPFWPGGDYEAHEYPEGCVVIDNPPFSMLAKIRRFYHARGIKYFLFAPTLAMAGSSKELDATYIICGETIIYENGASVSTSFITNLECGGLRIWVAGDLSKEIKQAQSALKKCKEYPAYSYPANVVSPALLKKISKRGCELKIRKSDCVAITHIDSQRKSGKTLFGGGWLLSERAAAERAAAERAAARNITYWELSDREREIIKSLG